jgi:hypothetical protein
LEQLIDRWNVDFPLSPSALPWWGWLICALFAAIVGYVIVLIFQDLSTEKKDYSPVMGIVWIIWIAGAFALLVGLVRFVKWAWGE